MYKAIVLACLISSPEQCWEFVDTRGPYQTIQQCTARSYEMANAIREIHKGGMEPQQFKCEPLVGMKL